MTHLEQTGFGYFQHMFRALHIALVLVVHAIFPWVWENKASSMLCSHDNQDQT